MNPSQGQIAFRPGGRCAARLPLASGQVGDAEHADVAGAPRLRRGPLDQVVNVLAFLAGQQAGLAAGGACAAHNGAPTSGSANILAAGSTCCGVTTDFSGNARTSPPIGAEEFVSSTVATPTASPGPGTYTSTQSVTLSTATPGATICYTTDGSTPTATSPGTCSHGTTYSTAISISSTTTLQAIGTLSGDTNSAIFNGVYTITSVAPPTGLKVQGVTMQGVILQ